MKATTAVLFLTAALGASARPSGAAHRHAHRRNVDFYKAVRPAPEPTTEAAPVVPTTTSEPAAEPTTSPSDGNDKGTGGGFKEFCGGKKYAKRATLDQIMYAGNVGAPDDYGCNLQLIDDDVADKYKYVTTIENEGDKPEDCACFLKVGPDGGINGFFAGNEALRFTVAPGASQKFAADENTQGGCACDANKLTTTAQGAFGGVWLEFDFGNESNNGWSGADASCLVSAAHGLKIPGMEVCGHGTCSTINPGGTGTNAYLGGMEAEDGVGLNLVPGEARLNVKVGFTDSR